MYPQPHQVVVAILQHKLSKLKACSLSPYIIQSKQQIFWTKIKKTLVFQT
jgi:hypothetical protein